MMSKFRSWISSPSGVRKIINIYGPYVGAGVKVTHIAPDYSAATVEMNLRWYNTNYVGTHFGGSLYSMVDPMYMLLLMNRLGKEYIVWDKSACIDFIRPGTGRVSAHFELTDNKLDEIRTATANGDKMLPQWDVDIVDQQDELVARVNKVLYVRKKPEYR
ncbi:DUF4442 domain-containing protein [Marinobacter sp. X15-166B]|uniref:DUF4442 domain-containing protein n=1 Tax=Marinobacter sp. X15-166B TaxID=1897620 RepID=UPI00085BF08F|nr:DUF4442 domain-containing protein [Marinobacter sp. X15-166B]OEY65303.1 tetrameric acyl-CoA thioesterase [Marinobacter sp. X15-166B]